MLNIRSTQYTVTEDPLLPHSGVQRGGERGAGPGHPKSELTKI